MPDPKNNATHRSIGIASGLIAALIWGGFPVMTRLGVTDQSLDGWDVTFIRFVTAALITLPILFRHGFSARPLWSVPVMVSGLGFPYILIIAKGLEAAPVQQFAAITPAMMIVLSTILASLLAGRAPPPRVLAGVSVIFFGVALMGYASLHTDGVGNLWSYGMFLLGAMLWAIYTVVTRQIGISALHATALVSFWSALSMTPIYFLLRGDALLSAPMSVIWVQALYQGVLVAVIALFFYSKSVQNLGAIGGAVFAALVPGLATLYAAVFLQEQLSYLGLVSIGIVSLGMIFTLTRAR